MLQMIKADPTPIVPQYNKKRNYNDKEEMKRWVGTTIGQSFRGPELDKVQVKLSKKFLKSVNPKLNTYKVPSTTNDFFNPHEKFDFRAKSELKNNDDHEKFVWVDNTRKVGRQRIPQQYLEREEMIRTSMP